MALPAVEILTKRLPFSPVLSLSFKRLQLFSKASPIKEPILLARIQMVPNCLSCLLFLTDFHEGISKHPDFIGK